MKPLIAIIGGKGRMATFLGQQWVWKECVERITVIDKGDELTRVQTADIIILAVPLSAMDGVIAQLMAVVQKNQLVVDIGSTKNSFIGELKKLPCRIVSIHPLFGNHVNGFEGQNVAILSDIGTKKDQKEVQGLFQGATISEVTLKEHEQGMKYALFLPFILRKAFMNVRGPVQVGKLSTPSYRLFERYAQHVLDDPLEAQVVEEILNANKKEVRELIKDIQKELQKIEDELK